MDYTKRGLEAILSQLKSGKISKGVALKKLRYLPFQDIGFAKIDFHRAIRKGFPEVIYAPGKAPLEIAEIAKRMVSKADTLLITKATWDLYDYLTKIIPGLKFNEPAKMIYYQSRKVARKKGLTLVVTAGTSDIPIAEEACLTLEILGNNVKRLYDVGVAGIHRVVDRLDLIKRAKVIIVVAGMEGALASIIGGLTASPVIAVPTSVGYGASFGGLSSLLTMLNSCAPGVCVVNIDNGFGAGYFASLINPALSITKRRRIVRKSGINPALSTKKRP